MIKVLVVDDHHLVRNSVVRLLSDFPGIEIIAEASSGEDAIKIAKEKRPDVILMDIKMPGLGGFEATRKILKSDPHIKIIALTTCGSEPLPTKLLQLGASGYLTKDVSIEEVINAIQIVYSGKRYLASTIAQNLALQTLEPEKSPFDSLTGREIEVILMITSGKSVQAIADKLCVSPKTVNSYRYQIYEKLNIQNDVELTLLAMKYGMLDLGI